ncbi:MAG: rod shape-determining protein MreC [Alphaproteobacteria bacterium]|nr:MAG: rod shape-determining protein MreC [Alphaproteobacteria bacterium]
MSRISTRTPDNVSLTQMLAQRASFIIAIFISLGLLIFGKIDDDFNLQVQRLVVDIVTPVAQTVRKPVDWAVSLGAIVEAYTLSAEESAALRQENDQLRLLVPTSDQLASENTRLRALLALPSITDSPKIMARSVTHPGSAFLWTVLLDAGADDGVEVYHPVVDHAGVVGRILSVGRRSSRVLLVTDLNSRIPVLIESSGDRAIMEGNNSRLPVLSFLEAAHQVSPGDRVLTSGDGGVFPSLLPIGTVTSPREGELRVEIFADLSRLEYVQILAFDPVPPPEQLVEEPLPEDDEGTGAQAPALDGLEPEAVE